MTIDLFSLTRRGCPRVLLATLGLTASAAAQEPTASPWTWSADANVIVGYNYQQRLLADFSAWESQNWFMGRGERGFGSGRLSIASMLSLEPFTIPAEGSPQLFQTGESCREVPLVNHQHPHDLIMELGATYRLVRGTATWSMGADLVGSPTLGPPPFMHRESARDNPQVPITHHFMDSTHITTGVVRAGIATGPFAFEASVFRGAEPDENRFRTVRRDAVVGVDRLRRPRAVVTAQRPARLGAEPRIGGRQRRRRRFSAGMGRGRERALVALRPIGDRRKAAVRPRLPPARVRAPTRVLAHRYADDRGHSRSVDRATEPHRRRCGRDALSHVAGPAAVFRRLAFVSRVRSLATGATLCPAPRSLTWSCYP